jgi:hypothetical protein
LDSIDGGEMTDYATAYRQTGITREQWVLAMMRMQLEAATLHCIITGNTTGAYVYARLCARAHNPWHYIEWLALNV